MDSVEKSFGHQNYEFFKEWHLFNMTFGLLHPDNLTINTIGCISENEHGKSFFSFRFTRIYIFSLNEPCISWKKEDMRHFIGSGLWFVQHFNRSRKSGPNKSESAYNTEECKCTQLNRAMVLKNYAIITLYGNLSMQWCVDLTIGRDFNVCNAQIEAYTETIIKLMNEDNSLSTHEL